MIPLWKSAAAGRPAEARRLLERAQATLPSRARIRFVGLWLELASKPHQAGRAINKPQVELPRRKTRLKPYVVSVRANGEAGF